MPNTHLPTTGRPPLAIAAPRAAAAAVRRRWLLGMPLIALLCMASSLAVPVRADDTPSPAPSIDYGPDEVVEIVVDALRDNPQLEGDAGIETVFRFASPGNRRATGPLERFAGMIKRGFSDMLGFASSRYEAIEVQDDKAVQVVWLMQRDGRETGYAFQLGRQSGGEFDGMWMTEAVVPLGEGPRSGTSI